MLSVHGTGRVPVEHNGTPGKDAIKNVTIRMTDIIKGGILGVFGPHFSEKSMFEDQCTVPQSG
jgi:hypothetical protein